MLNLQKKLLIASAVMLCTVILTACSGNSSSQIATTPSAQLSEDDAYTLAYEAYDDFNTALLVFGTNREEGEKLLKPLVNEEIFNSTIETDEILRERGQYLDGTTEFFNFQLKEFSDTRIVALTCVDTSAYRLRNANKEDITNPELSDLQPYIANWSVSGRSLVLEGIDWWSDQDICL